jgi:hypothetical protein
MFERAPGPRRSCRSTARSPSRRASAAATCSSPSAPRCHARSWDGSPASPSRTPATRGNRSRTRRSRPALRRSCSRRATAPGVPVSSPAFAMRRSSATPAERSSPPARGGRPPTAYGAGAAGCAPACPAARRAGTSRIATAPDSSAATIPYTYASSATSFAPTSVCGSPTMAISSAVPSTAPSWRGDPRHAALRADRPPDALRVPADRGGPRPLSRRPRDDAVGHRHAGFPDGPPLVLRHRSCGELTEPRTVCSECGEPIHARDVEPLPGPGAR